MAGRHRREVRRDGVALAGAGLAGGLTVAAAVLAALATEPRLLRLAAAFGVLAAALAGVLAMRRPDPDPAVEAAALRAELAALWAARAQPTYRSR